MDCSCKYTTQKSTNVYAPNLFILSVRPNLDQLAIIPERITIGFNLHVNLDQSPSKVHGNDPQGVFGILI